MEGGDGIAEGANLVAVDYEGDGGRDVVVPTVNGFSTLSVADDGELSDPVLHPHGLQWWRAGRGMGRSVSGSPADERYDWPQAWRRSTSQSPECCPGS